MGRGGSHLWVGPRPRQGSAPGLWGAFEAALRTPSSSWRKNNSLKFSSNSEEISRSGFFEIENSKNSELALGIYVGSPIKSLKMI